MIDFDNVRLTEQFFDFGTVFTSMSLVKFKI